jgi:hypothetical protein
LRGGVAMRAWLAVLLGCIAGCAQGLDAAPGAGTGGVAGVMPGGTGGTGGTGATGGSGGTGATGGSGGSGATGGSGGSGATGGSGGSGATGGSAGSMDAGFDAGPLPPACSDEGATCFGFTPSHVDLGTLTFAGAPDALLDCGAITIDTSAGGATFGNWCGTAPTPVVQSQTGGPDVVVIPLNGVELPTGNSIVVRGTLPVVFAVRGNVTIAGTIDASAEGASAGPAAELMCGTATGQAGAGDDSTGAGGGGGGGFVSAGGGGGDGGSDAVPGVAGTPRDAATLSLLVGGCAGGLGGACTEPVGAGGGALSFVVSGRLTVSGSLDVSGGEGSEGCGSEGGGSGGGSGGSLVLEAEQLLLSGATLNAAGGMGGAGASGGDGGMGATSAAAGSPGEDGGADGGGGGGGGYGRLVTAGADWCQGCP